MLVIPPIVTNLGALKERVEKEDIGWVVDYENPEKICELLKFLALNKNKIREKRDRIYNLKLTTLEEMKREYTTVYNFLLSKTEKKQFDSQSIEKSLQQLEQIRLKNNYKLTLKLFWLTIKNYSLNLLRRLLQIT